MASVSPEEIADYFKSFQKCSKAFGIKVEKPIYISLNNSARVDDFLNNLEKLK